jgi:hypothetical protein
MSSSSHENPRPGRLIDGLLIATLVAIGVLIYAYLHMPDVERGAATLLNRVADQLNLE